MRIDMKFSCPSCGGYVEFWAIRQGLTCPFCNGVLKSNAHSALRRSVVVGIAVGIVTVILLGTVTGEWWLTLIFGPELGVLFGLFAGLLFLRFSLSLWATPEQ